MRGLVSLIIVASALMVAAAYSQESDQFKKSAGIDYAEQSQLIGPIKPTDTLWRIAVKVRPDNSVTIYQVMQALYNQNPNSFLEQNLNHIKNGTYLKVPTLAQIKRVNNQLARQRSEQDDKLWAAKQRGAITQTAANQVQDQLMPAPVDDINIEAGKALAALAKNNKLLQLQQQFKQSVNNLEEILVENDNLKQQLTNVSNELNQVRQQLGQDSEIQQQLKELIVKQNEIIAQQKAKQGSGFDLVSELSNSPVVILLISIAVLLIVFAAVMLIRNRANKRAQAQHDDFFIPQVPHNATNILVHDNLETNISAPKHGLASVLNNDEACINARAQRQAHVFFAPPDLDKEGAAQESQDIDFALPASQSNDGILNVGDEGGLVDGTAAALTSKPIDNNITAGDSTELHEETEKTVNVDTANNFNTAIDATLANSLEELTEVRAALKCKDIAAITTAFNQQRETEYQHDLSAGCADTPESLSQREDNAEEYNDDNLKSVDELLDELQHVSEGETSQHPIDKINEDSGAGLTAASAEEESQGPSPSLTGTLRDPQFVELGEQADNEPALLGDPAQNIVVNEPPVARFELDSNSLTATNKDQQLKAPASELTDQAIDDFLIELDDIQVNKQLNQDGSQLPTKLDDEVVFTPTTEQHNSDIAAADEVMVASTETEAVTSANDAAQKEQHNGTDDGTGLISPADQPLVSAKPKLSQAADEGTVIAEPVNAAKFVDIDSLFEQADTSELEYEPYNDVNIDVGLSEFEAFLAGDNLTDVDAESGGYAAKLDLARAYIEIDDADAALKMIEEIINKGPEEVQAEALSLKAKLK